MTITEMLGQSGVLAVLGMSMVFGFLVIMIISVSITGKIMQASGAGKGTAVPAAPANSESNAAANAESITAAISAAVNEYRKSN